MNKRKWLAAARALKGMTQEQVAQESGISVLSYNYLETGRTKEPTVYTAKAVAKTLGFDWLKFYEEEA